jgi:hypothetical protein
MLFDRVEVLLGTRRRWAVSFTIRSPYPEEKQHVITAVFTF